MVHLRYTVTCNTCGTIEADTEDGLFRKATAHRRAGWHEGSFGDGHACTVTVEEEIPEFICPICKARCVGVDDRDDHAEEHPDLPTTSFGRI